MKDLHSITTTQFEKNDEGNYVIEQINNRVTLLPSEMDALVEEVTNE